MKITVTYEITPEEQASMARATVDAVLDKWTDLIWRKGDMHSLDRPASFNPWSLYWPKHSDREES